MAASAAMMLFFQKNFSTICVFGLRDAKQLNSGHYNFYYYPAVWLALLRSKALPRYSCCPPGWPKNGAARPLQTLTRRSRHKKAVVEGRTDEGDDDAPHYYYYTCNTRSTTMATGWRKTLKMVK